jgi:Leucine-rich repeat (LRR) protein
MEEFDDLIQKPDEDGLLDLSHRAWVKLDDTLWEFGETLLVLNVSYNNVSTLSPGIGELSNLRELDFACNQLTELPPEIGKCSRLKKLKINGNRLETLPEEIENCSLLQEIIASENGMLEIPASIGKLDMLKTLKLQNNNLKELPPELGDCLSLEVIDVTINSDLEMIPEKLRADAKLILWTCQNTKDHRGKIDEMEGLIEQMQELAKLNDEKKIKLSDQITALEKEKIDLIAERPERYLKFVKRSQVVKSKLCITM